MKMDFSTQQLSLEQRQSLEKICSDLNCSDEVLCSAGKDFPLVLSLDFPTGDKKLLIWQPVVMDYKVVETKDDESETEPETEPEPDPDPLKLSNEIAHGLQVMRATFQSDEGFITWLVGRLNRVKEENELSQLQG